MPMRELSDSGVPQRTSELLASYFQTSADKFKSWLITPPGRTPKSQAFNQSWAQQKVQQLNQEINLLKARSSNWAAMNHREVAIAAAKTADNQARELGVLSSDGTLQGRFGLIDVNTVKIFAADTVQREALKTYHDLAKAADSMQDRTATLLRGTADLGLSQAEINRILAGGVIEGKPDVAIRTLRDELQKLHGDKVEIAGRNYDVKYYAEMVVRTRTRAASVIARHERLEALGLDLVSIVGRISDNFCTAFLGQVFSLSGRSSKYPSYASLPGGGPPFHPNCSKSTRPFVEALATKGQLATAEGVDEADKLLGKTPAEAQRSFKDLQLRQAVQKSYGTTAKALFG